MTLVDFDIVVVGTAVDVVLSTFENVAKHPEVVFVAEKESGVVGTVVESENVDLVEKFFVLLVENAAAVVVVAAVVDKSVDKTCCSSRSSQRLQELGGAVEEMATEMQAHPRIYCFLDQGTGYKSY